MSSVTYLGNDIYQIDVHDQGMPQRTCCYLIAAEKPALIETGAAPGSAYLMNALEELGISPEKVHYIIVTHIHLDHAGGAGTMVRMLPEARVLVHPRGARHLLDPSRLIAGARMVYGERFDGFFGEILPVPEDRVHTPEDGENLDLGGSRKLTFYHTQGHARHHFVIYDRFSRGVFSGDALGIRFQALSELVGYDFTLPSTSPSEFDPPEAVAVFTRMAGLAPENIFFTHYGKAASATAVLSRNSELVSTFEAAGRSVLAAGGGVKEIEKALWDLVLNELAGRGINDREHPAVRFLEMDMELNAAGIAHYLRKNM